MRKLSLVFLLTLFMGSIATSSLHADSESDKKEDGKKATSEDCRLPNFAKWTFTDVLGPDGSGRTAVAGVNNKGTVLGTYNDLITGQPRGYLFDAKNRYQLITINLAGQRDLSSSFTCLDDENKAYGVCYDSDGVSRGFVWSNGKTKELVYPGAYFVYPQTVSSDGTLLVNVYSYNAIGDTIISTFTYDKRGYRALPTVPPFTDYGFSSINVDGDLLGVAVTLLADEVTLERTDFVLTNRGRRFVELPVIAGNRTTYPQVLTDEGIVFGTSYNNDDNAGIPGFARPVAFALCSDGDSVQLLRHPNDQLGTTLSTASSKAFAGVYLDADFREHPFVARK